MALKFSELRKQDPRAAEAFEVYLEAIRQIELEDALDADACEPLETYTQLPYFTRDQRGWMFGTWARYNAENNMWIAE